VKRTRSYTKWFYLGDLEADAHDIRVELSANPHNPLTLDGELIDTETTITVAATDDAHDTPDPTEVMSNPAPSVSADLLKAP
jgi:hypothetical protein